MTRANALQSLATPYSLTTNSITPYEMHITMAKREHVTLSEKRKFKLLCLNTKPLMILNLIALIITISTWHLALQTIELNNPWLLLTVSISPLLMVLPGTLSGSYRGAIWTCFVTLIYFIAGVLNWIQVNAWAYGVSETMLSISLFLVALMYARWRGLSELPIAE